MDHPPSFSVLAIMGIAFIGFYDGFFGPGTGSLFALLMISMLGLGFRDATIHAKLFNTMTNLAAFLMFATSGLVIWSAVAIIIPGQVLCFIGNSRHDRAWNCFDSAFGGVHVQSHGDQTCI